jgi:outer membrane murein-binding lipoprotein Lpp
MAYDIAILVMMATAIGGIMYAQWETARKGVRYIRGTRVANRLVEHGNQPHPELKVPYFGPTAVGAKFLGYAMYVGGLVCAAVLVYFEISGQLALRRERREFDGLRQQIQQLQQKNEQLDKRITALQSDARAIESLAEQMRFLGAHGFDSK